VADMVTLLHSQLLTLFRAIQDARVVAKQGVVNVVNSYFLRYTKDHKLIKKYNLKSYCLKLTNSIKKLFLKKHLLCSINLHNWDKTEFWPNDKVSYTMKIRDTNLYGLRYHATSEHRLDALKKVGDPIKFVQRCKRCGKINNWTK
jgi:hypothetical protein